MPKIEETGVVIPLPKTVMRALRRYFARDEFERALSITLCALCNNDPPERYLNDVIAQSTNNYHDFAEELHRYSYLMLDTRDYLREQLSELVHADDDTVFSIRDLRIESGDNLLTSNLVFVLQQIELELPS